MAVDRQTAARTDLWGRMGAVLLSLVATSTTLVTGELDLPVWALTAATTAAVVVLGLALRPGARTGQLLVWPLLALAHLFLLSALAPAAGALGAGFYVIVLVYVGMVAAPWVGLALLPVPALGLWLALDLPTDQALVRIATATFAFAVSSQLPARLMQSIHEQRLRADAEHDTVLRVQTEAASAAQMLSRTFDASPVGMALSDEQGHFVQVNPALCTMLQRTPAELIGKSAGPFSHPDDAHQHLEVEALMADSEDGVVQFETRLVRADGDTCWISLTLAPVFGPQGQTWTLAHHFDINERKAAEAAARKIQEASTVVATIAQATQLSLDPRQAIVEGVARLTGADGVGLAEPDGDHLVVTASYGSNFTGTRVPIDQTSMMADVWRTGIPRSVADVTLDPLINPALVQLMNARSGFWRPIESTAGRLGVLIATWTELHDPSQHDESMRLVSTEAAAALTAERLRTSLEHSAVTDPLTSLLNRRGWDEAIANTLDVAHRESRDVAVAMVDLDHFKAYNDTHGHATGDRLLVDVATLLRTRLRVTDLVSRWGGDEFAVAMPGCPLDVAAKLLAQVRGSLPDGQSLSVGLAVAHPGDDLAETMARADTELYRAKAARDTVA